MKYDGLNLSSNDSNDDIIFAIQDPTSMNKSKFDKAERLASIDCFRGLSIILMIFGLTQSILKEDNIPVFKVFHYLDKFEGFQLGDFVSPLFIFILGASCYLSQRRKKGHVLKQDIINHTLKKFLFLFLMGFIFNFFSYKNPFSSKSFINLKITSACLRLSIINTTIYLLSIFGVMTLSIVTCTFFFTYLLFIHFLQSQWCNNYIISEYCNFCAKFDNWLFSRNHMNYPTDPFGIFNLLNVFYTAFVGYITLYFLKNEKEHQHQKKHNIMVALGIPLINIILFVVFKFLFKNIYSSQLYSSSFMFLATGISGFIFGVIHFIIEIQKFDCFRCIVVFFESFGLNSIATYIICEVYNIFMYQTSLGKIFVENVLKFTGWNEEVRAFIYSFASFILISITPLIFYFKEIFFSI